jgi:hypothetical protein
LGELQTISSKPTRTQLRRWTRCRAAWGRYAVTLDRVAALDTDERLARVDLPPPVPSRPTGPHTMRSASGC